MTDNNDNTPAAPENLIRFPGSIVRDPQNPGALPFAWKRSLMWLLFRDMLTGGDIHGAAHYLTRRLRRPCVIFDEGHALAIHLVGRPEGSSFRLPPERRKVEKRLLKHIEKTLVHCPMTLNRLELPNDDYWIGSLVANRPGSTAEFIHTQMGMRVPSRLGFRAFTTAQVDDAYLAQTEQCLRNWHARCVNFGVNGERFPAGEIVLARYHEPAAPNRSPETGLQVTFPYTQGLTWPWLDLYSRTRRTYEKGKRLSFRFYHV